MTSFKRMLCMSVIGTCALLADTWTGYLTDAKCAKDGNYMGADHKKCLESGQPMVFVNEADKSVHIIANADKVDVNLVGQKVTVDGTAKPDGSIVVATAKAIPTPSAP